MKKNKGPKILTIDIETSPLEVYAWGIHDQNVRVNQIKTDWQILSFAAKWLHQKNVLVMGQDKYREVVLITALRMLLNVADIVVTQNGKSFDIKKINAKILQYGMKPPKSFQQIDTRQLAKKHFGLTSNSLEYMSKKLKLKYQKLSHSKFPGMELWKECLKGNRLAWKEMLIYNKHDVLATEELYKKLIPWDNTVNFNVYYGSDGAKCTCGSTNFSRNGYAYTSTGKYQRFECKECGSELKSKTNLQTTKYRGTKR